VTEQLHDIERGFVEDFVPRVLADWDVGVVTPDTDIPATGFIRVVGLGGTEDGVTKYHRVTLDVFHPDRHQAFGAARDLHAALHPRARVGSATIDHVKTDVSPRQLPWDNPHVRRFSATYTISVR
jgi:hypothetical protein